MSAFENMCHSSDLVDEALKMGKAVAVITELINGEHVHKFEASKDRSLTSIHESTMMMLILMCEGSEHSASIFSKNDAIVEWVLDTLHECS